MRSHRWIALAMGLGLLAGCAHKDAARSALASVACLVGSESEIDPLAPIPNPTTVGEQIVNGAKEQVRRAVRYVADYASIAYPGGDVPSDQGVCTDVVIRALRHAGYDLQVLIHKDMKRNFAKYPPPWGQRGPDPSIDHRRVPNQICFFKRHGLTLTTEVSHETLEEWQPGDLVYWKLDNGRDHCGVISEIRNCHGEPFVIHNLGGARMDDRLTRWKIIGHFRYP